MSLDTLCDTHTATLERSVKSKDASGGAVRVTWNAVDGAASFPLAVQALSHRERLLWAQRQVMNTHRAYFTRDVAALRDDRLHVTSGPNPNFTPFYLVLTGNRDMAGRGRVYFVMGYETAR